MQNAATVALQTGQLTKREAALLLLGAVRRFEDVDLRFCCGIPCSSVQPGFEKARMAVDKVDSKLQRPVCMPDLYGSGFWGIKCNDK